MKIIGNEIEAVVQFKLRKRPIPVKFGIQDTDGSRRVIKIDKITSVDEEKLAGIKSFVYRCQSFIEGELILYERKYYIQDCKWVLYKM